MKVAVLSANIGGIDQGQEHVKQSIPCDYHIVVGGIRKVKGKRNCVIGHSCTVNFCFQSQDIITDWESKGISTSGVSWAG